MAKKSSKLKGIIACLLAATVVAGGVIGGSLAYLQDEDSDVNVMTLGNVDITQNEYQRDENPTNPTKLENGLYQFEDNKPLFPAVGTPDTYIDLKDATTDSNSEYKFLAVNGTDLPNAVDKIITVTNTGESDAYVRTLIAFEIADDITEVTERTDIGLMRNDISGNKDNDNATLSNSDWRWEWLDQPIEVDGQKYAVAVVTHEAILGKGEETIPSLLQVYLKSHVDNEYVAKFNGTYEILALSQAVQAQGFTATTDKSAAQNALDTAFNNGNKVTPAKAQEWFTGVSEEPFASVYKFNKNDTITNKNGNVTVLKENLTIDTTRSQMGFDVGEISLDTAYQFEPTMTYEEGKNSEYAKWHADFVVSVDKDIPAYGIGLAGYYDAWCTYNNDKWVMMAHNDTIKAGEEIRLVQALGSGSITVNYEELCNYGNDGIGFLCGAVALDGETIEGESGPITAQLEDNTTLTVELRLYETEEPSPENGNSVNVETGKYITTGVYTYTFNKK